MDIKILVNSGNGYEQMNINSKSLTIIKQIIKLNILEKEEPKKKDWRVADTKEKLKAINDMFTLGNKYPEIIKYYNYFSKYKSRNAYLVIIKQVVIDRLISLKAQEPMMTYKVIGSVLGLKHTTVLFHSHIDKKQRHQDYDKISSVIDEMIQKELYPKVAVDKKTGITEYKWVTI
jgi:hypothetical protein